GIYKRSVAPFFLKIYLSNLDKRVVFVTQNAIKIKFLFYLS
ncbi:MAG: hypothetical protein ACI9O5_002553, partial [Algoriphagus sp.]